MNIEKICCVRGRFNNLYAWGSGWTSDKREKWDEYLENYKGIFWKPFKRKGTWYLVGIQGSIYLHPMDFRTVLHSVGGCTPRGHNDDLEDYFGEELDELLELCTELAKACGGTFGPLVAQAQDVENNRFINWERGQM